MDSKEKHFTPETLIIYTFLRKTCCLLLLHKRSRAMEGKRLTPSILPFFLLSLLILTPFADCRKKRLHRSCKNLVLYFHDIVYNGKNMKNATSAIVAAPVWANRTALANLMHFGDMVVFDDPITLDNNLHSEPVGRAQGMYLYDKKEIYTAWLAFTFVLNSTEHQGTLNFLGADPLMNKTRDISVVGGTGDFLMSRGIATIMTDAYEDEVYFRLRVDIKLYECY